MHHVHDVPFAQFAPLWYRYADNLAYLCHDVSEGWQCLERSRSLLAQAKYALKGADGPPVDLRTGTAQMLGFTVTMADQGVRLGLGKGAWERLRQTLLLGHQATDPPSYARRAVDGWINAYGPAFEYRQDDTLSVLMEIVLDLGYGEVDSLDSFRAKMEKANYRWRVLRDTVYREKVSLEVS